MLSGSDRVRLALGFEGYNMKKLFLALAFLPLAWVMPVHAVPLPQFTYSFARYARWDRFSHADPLPKYGVAGLPSLWWWDAAKAAKTGGRT